MSERHQTVVIGGGLAGIAAALELKKAGRKVLVLEKEEVLGGKTGTFVSPHGPFPTGPTSFNGRNAIFWRLLRLLELEDEALKLAPSSSARFIVRNGKLEALRPNPLSVLTTGALTFSDKSALVKDFLSRKRSAGSGEDESLDSFLERRFGRSLVDHFFAAVLTGIFAGDLKKLSAASCMPSLVTAEREYGSVLRGILKSMKNPEDGSRPGLYTFKDALGRIPAKAAQVIDHRTGITVSSLIPKQGGVLIRAQGKEGSVEIEADEVVIATEAFVTAELLASFSPEAANILRAFPYAPLALYQWVELEPGSSRLPLGFGYLAAPIEENFAMGMLFVGDLLAETPRRFSAFIGGAVHPERAHLSDAELAKGVEGDLTRLTGGKLGPVANVQRWPKAVFQPPVGHLAQLELLSQAMGEGPVALAGSYFGGAAMKDAIASGFRAAERLLDKAQRRKAG